MTNLASVLQIGTNPNQMEGRSPYTRAEVLADQISIRRESPRPTEDRRDRRYAVPKLAKDARRTSHPNTNSTLKRHEQTQPTQHDNIIHDPIHPQLHALL
jgi:hypothetical protein